MRVKLKKRTILETIIFSFLPGVVGLFFLTDPGFSRLFFLPYFGVSLVLSAFYGKIYGFLSLFSVSVWISLFIPLVLILVPVHALPVGYWRDLAQKSIIPAPLAIAGVYIFGMIRDALAESLSKTRGRLKELVKENQLLKKTTSALSEVDRELEERVSRQQESITMLYERIHQLENVRLDEALDLLLETVQLFTKATRLSIWEHQHNPPRLTLAASKGWDETDGFDTTREIENSIEGWVFKNNTMFYIT